MIWVSDALHPQPLQQQRRCQLSHQVHRHGIGLKKQPAGNSNDVLNPRKRENAGLQYSFCYSHLSNFRSPCDRNLIGYSRRKSDKRCDVQRSTWSLLFNAIFWRRCITLKVKQGLGIHATERIEFVHTVITL